MKLLLTIIAVASPVYTQILHLVELDEAKANV